MKILKLILSFILHTIAISIITYTFWPIGQWYLNHRPLLGIDFFLTTTIARLFQNDAYIIPQKFLYFWFSGSPAANNIIFLWYEIIGWVAKIIPLVTSVKYTMLASFMLLLLFTYLCAYRLSKNYFISAFISILVAYSANLYGSLTWGGSLPFFANQLFFPAILWTIVSYIQTGNKRWYWTTVLLMGLSLLGHLLNTGAFILPGTLLILLLGQRRKSINFFKKIIEAVILIILSYLFSIRLTMNTYAGALFQIFQSIFSKIPKAITTSVIQSNNSGNSINNMLSLENQMAEVDKSRFMYLYTDTHLWLFILFAIGICVFILTFLLIRTKVAKISYILPWLILCAYSTIHVFFNAYGVSFFLFQGWYREFWHFPIVLGLLCASLFGYVHINLRIASKFLGTLNYSFVLILTVIGLAICAINTDSKKTISLLEYRSSTSSAYPEKINLVKSESEYVQLKNNLTPQWLDPNDRNYRLFTSDAQMNVWWNALFNMPLVRGYLDPVTGSGTSGNFFLLDQAISGNGLVENLKFDESIARNIALYYLDWYSIRYFEGGHLSQSANKNISSYISDVVSSNEEVKTDGAYLYDVQNKTRYIDSEVVQKLNYYQISDEYTSPIVSSTNAPAVLCFCDWSSYESLTKILSMHNINSNNLITIYNEQNVDDYNINDLKNFPVIFLSNYNYGNKTKAFNILKEYINSGGKVFIDTGGVVPESKAAKLPDIFPFDKSNREGLGNQWVFSLANDEIFNNIDFNKFSPPVYEREPWNIVYPLDQVDKDAVILLSQNKKPVLIRKDIGSGKLYWSGMNFAYHIQYYNNFEESKFFINILKELITIDDHQYETGNVKFKGDREVEFSNKTSTKAILVRQAFFPGWKIVVNGKSVKGYAAGPNYPGFIYVPLKDQSSIKATFIYQGSFRSWFIWSLSVIVLCFLIDQIIFSGWIMHKFQKQILHRLHFHTKTWWNKEE